MYTGIVQITWRGQVHHHLGLLGGGTYYLICHLLLTLMFGMHVGSSLGYHSYSSAILHCYQLDLHRSLYVVSLCGTMYSTYHTVFHVAPK